MAGHCERDMRRLLPSLLEWQHWQVRFASTKEDYQSYAVDDESLLMSRWANQVLSNGWCWDQKWLDVRMSRMSNTAECENRELVYLTLSKGGRITRVTPTSTWLTALIQINQKFCPKRLLILYWISKQKCYPHYRTMRLCFCDMKPYGVCKMK